MVLSCQLGLNHDNIPAVETWEMIDKGSKRAQQEDSKLQWSQKIAAGTTDKELTCVKWSKTCWEYVRGDYRMEERGNDTAKIGKKKSHTRCRQIMPVQLQKSFPPLLKIGPKVGETHTNLFSLLSYKAHHIHFFISFLECFSGYQLFYRIVWNAKCI